MDVKDLAEKFVKEAFSAANPSPDERTEWNDGYLSINTRGKVYFSKLELHPQFEHQVVYTDEYRYVLPNPLWEQVRQELYNMQYVIMDYRVLWLEQGGCPQFRIRRLNPEISYLFIELDGLKKSKTESEYGMGPVSAHWNEQSLDTLVRRAG